MMFDNFYNHRDFIWAWKKLAQMTTKKLLFGLNLNRSFLKNYRFRDLQNQTRELTAICGYTKIDRKNKRKR